MATFPFVVSAASSPPIEVVGVNLSYEELLNSFGDYCYLFEKIFSETISYSQANQVISFLKYDVNGNKKTDVITPVIDPYQKQPAILIDLGDNSIIADGRLQMSFDLLPMSWDRFTFFTKRVFAAQGLDKFAPDNKAQVKNV